MNDATPIILSLTPASRELAQSLATRLAARHQPADTDTTAKLRDAFVTGHPIIAIMATGIIIRALAPHLSSKHTDAPVIGVSQDGQHIVPLLGGHHGANAFARKIAAVTGGTAAITTAGDTRFNISLDEPPRGYTLTNPSDTKPFMAALLEGQSIRPQESFDWPQAADLPFSDTGKLRLTCTRKLTTGSAENLVYAPHDVCIGLGCERGTDAGEIIKLVENCLAAANLSPHAIAAFASLDLKADEVALHKTAAHFARPLRFFTARALNAHGARLENPSDIVRREVGCPGVAEGSALALAGPQSRLLVAKTKSTRATCAIALAEQPISEPDGRARGKLSVVGLGPGSRDWRSPHATKALDAASDWVGYDLYLDLAGDLKTTQTEHRFPLGAEEPRVRHALKLAGKGRNVALVCSGDAAIYAMAALVFEMLDVGDLPDAHARVEIDVVPGISAFQAASARAGALIGHDFCTISLSDLLTPWATIEHRLDAAAKGDFNVAFYNPRSRKRTDQLARAIEILTPHRRPDTPVIVASNLGRPSETVKTVALQDFDPGDVDMLTIVLVGSSQSRPITRGDGKTCCYTPRGYASKHALKEGT